MTAYSYGYEDKLPQGNHRTYGAILLRNENTPKALDLLLFLKGMGAVWVSAPGAAAKNRFGGAVEPLVWGSFDLYQSPRRLYVKNIDVKEDFLKIRSSPKKLTVAMKWCKRLARSLPARLACDDVLSLFWGSLTNLASDIAPNLADMRFAWRWGNLWGVAPTLDSCCSCGKNLTDATEALAKGREGLICEACARTLAARGGGTLAAAAAQAAHRAATLPREAFMAYAGEVSANLVKDLGDCAQWFYTFLDTHK